VAKSDGPSDWIQQKSRRNLETTKNNFEHLKSLIRLALAFSGKALCRIVINIVSAMAAIFTCYFLKMLEITMGQWTNWTKSSIPFCNSSSLEDWPKVGVTIGHEYPK
jgi:hypothetical protein